MPIELLNSRGVYVIPTGDDIGFLVRCIDHYQEMNSQMETLYSLLQAGF